MIGKNIGEGTFGKVKAGTHNVTGEKVSVQIYEMCVTEWVLLSLDRGYKLVYFNNTKEGGRPIYIDDDT